MLLLREKFGTSLEQISQALFEYYENSNEQDIVKKITKPAGFLYDIYNGHHVSDEAMQQFAEEIGITKIAKGKFSH